MDVKVAVPRAVQRGGASTLDSVTWGFFIYILVRGGTLINFAPGATNPRTDPGSTYLFN